VTIDQRDVSVFASAAAEGAVEEDLPRGAHHEVGAADDLVDAICLVIDDHSKLIRRSERRPGDKEISPIPLRVDRQRPQKQVVPVNQSFGHTETPGERTIAEPHSIRCSLP
jgi:hypothetical protein